jgi:L-alanine-DL-glutamate epimerase-like enolase superfamily enzyme
MVVSDGTESWREDVARVRAVRDIIGPECDLMIDANYMTDPHSAKKLCLAIEELDITWFEEPVYAVDSWNMGELRACTKVPISAGQNIPSRWRFRELITNHAIDIAQPNPVWSGFTETVKISHLAQAFNMPVANGGGWPIINMHNIAGLQNGMWVEFHLGMQALGEAIYSNAPRPENNIIKIPDIPGLGLEPNFDVLNDCIVKD